ncbi:mutS protein homolog 5-like [Macrosteles quadrilineatus]|uniref:mutS protein homolog 5-like n=1 Tax=Macrosteles quadrilineatus TaxID=74068 RepID=UPI0023E2167A|nr:mutS protein homolog 5-like [Macrosteles quadrilineatus]
MHHFKYSHVVTSSSLSQPFLLKVHGLITGQDLSVTPSVDPPTYSERLHFIPAKEFRYTTCKRSVLELKLPMELEDVSEEDRHTYIMSQIDLSSEGLVAAIGGLLYFLQRSLTKIRLVASIEMPILRISYISMKDVVWIDNETLHALNIFSPGLHPSSFKWSSKANEGFCVFSLLNHCYSTVGSKHMRVMLSQPTKDINVIKKRQQVIAFCLRSINEQTVKSLADSIVNVKSVMKILTRMTNAQASVSQWKTFYNTIYNAVLVGEVCKANSTDIIFFREIADCLCDSIYLMSHCINRVMDFEKSVVQGRIVVKEGISDDLDKLTENRSRLCTLMDQLAEVELQDLPEYVESCSLSYIPESGFFLAVPLWRPDLTNEDLELPDMHFQFINEDSAHYKSSRCHELDNMLGDWLMQGMEIESKIILKLVQYIQRNVGPLVKLTALIAELDCLLALARAARDFNLVEPQMTLDKQIHIKRGRNILQELCVEMFVPNDTHSSVEDGLAKILNGPNASGKTVYLKQVAQIVYLAQVGSYVPAESATVGVVDQIHSRIHPVDAVDSQLSSFMVDLRQMSIAIRNFTSNSLVIIDEFGKGTPEVNGLGLLAACLEYFVAKNHECPHLFVSTHFHSLANLLPPSDNIKLQHLEHMLDKGELVFLYRLRDGVVGESFALRVAQNHVLTRPWADRAAQILHTLKNSGSFTADSDNRLTRMAAKRSQFLKDFSKAVLTEEKLSELKKELVGLRL